MHTPDVLKSGGYEVVDILGKGSYGEVKLANHPWLVSDHMWLEMESETLDEDLEEESCPIWFHCSENNSREDEADDDEDDQRSPIRAAAERVAGSILRASQRLLLPYTEDIFRHLRSVWAGLGWAGKPENQEAAVLQI